MIDSPLSSPDIDLECMIVDVETHGGGFEGRVGHSHGRYDGVVIPAWQAVEGTRGLRGE